MATGAGRGAASFRCAFAFLALLAMFGCTSNKSSRIAEDKSEQKAAPAAQSSSGPDIDLNCIIDHIQNPPEAFHYSYKKDSSSPWAEEADITPQTIDGSFTNSAGTHPIHGVRSDQQSWQGAWSGLMGIASMSSSIALVHSSAAIVPQGAEPINGYDTTKLSIDTSRGDAVEQGLYKSTLGEGGFEKGTAWVTPKGCPVKLVMDSEMHSRNGDVNKVHYDVEMVRK